MEKHISQIIQLVKDGASVTSDSRRLSPGDIFIALRGDRFNGNMFAAKAIENGCKIAIIDEPEFNKGNEYLLVDDSLGFLQQTSLEYRKFLDCPVLAITGTNGKTTTKELTHAVMSEHFKAQATQGNLNNHIGVPLTLLKLKNSTEIAIIEMGANHQGEIAALSEIAMPTHAIITNIGKAHLEGFGSIENIEKAKGELYNYVQKNKGTIFVNCDDNRLKKYAVYKNAVTFGLSNNNHCSGQVTSSFPFAEVIFKTNKPFGKAAKGIQGKVISKLTGSYNFSNIMAAITAGLYFGVPKELIINAIKGYTPRNNRSQIIQSKNNTIVMDAYNANPTSMAAALENFGQFKTTQKALMLGDMLELGKDAEHEHKTIAEMADNQACKLKVFVGEHFSAVCRNYKDSYVFKNVDDAAMWLKDNPLQGYHILIKGSRGISMEKLLNFL